MMNTAPEQGSFYYSPKDNLLVYCSSGESHGGRVWLEKVNETDPEQSSIFESLEFFGKYQKVAFFSHQMNNKMYHIDANGKPTPVNEPVSLRERVAIAAMQGLLANPSEQVVIASHRQCAEWAVASADALITELQKKEKAK